MKEITKSEMVSLLSENYLKNVLSIADIEYFDSHYYIDESNKDNYFIVSKFHEKDVVEIVCNKDKEFIDEVILYLKNRNFLNYELYLSNNEFIEYLLKNLNVKVQSSDHRAFLIYLEKQKKNIELQCIHKLCSEDITLAESFIMEELPARPSFSRLFTVFVNGGNGHINVIKLKNKIVGYISFYQETEEILNVDHIYILPEHRKKGYATELIKSYINYAIDHSMIPYYGPAIHEISIKSALKSGFSIIKDGYKYNISSL